MKKKVFDWNFRTESDFGNAIKVFSKSAKINPKNFYNIHIYESEHQRTISQNEVYWIFNTFLANQISQYESPQELHLIFRAMFLEKDILPIEFVSLRAYQIFTNAKQGLYEPALLSVIDNFAESTASLSTVKFSKYLEKIAQFSAATFELRLVFPDEPDWQLFRDNYRK